MSNRAGSQLHTIQHRDIRSGPPREFPRNLVDDIVSTLDRTERTRSEFGLCLHPNCSSCDVEFEGEVRCEIYRTRLQRFRGKVNGVRKPWKIWSVAQDRGRELERRWKAVPITSGALVFATRSVCILGWESWWGCLQEV